ncbi:MULTISPECIES: hypothetical protein [Brevibacterium]|uniref:Uncharacterized protein n=2 Tax=Brevibacterium TaxID=1696 RepID=A0A2H1KZC0_9MICO|nr:MULTISPECIES: hypothetical protein [Brevibacterium]SMY05080.1 hypothetical protein BANT918_03262 [Brevibacterium antiquum CNRZ 918]
MDATQIADSLKADHFYIDESAVGTLDSRLVDKAKSTTQGLDFDVYVIAVDDKVLDLDLLREVAADHGGEGSFVLISDTTQLYTEVQIEDDHDLAMQVMEQNANAHAQWSVQTPSLSKLNTLLKFYAHPEAVKEPGEPVAGQEVPGSDFGQESNSSSFAPMFLGGAVLVLALVIAGVFLVRTLKSRAAESRRHHEFRLPRKLLDRVDSLQRTSLRDDINADTSRIAGEIDRLQTSNLDADKAAKVERALDGYQIARSIVDDRDTERIDLAGAMVLLRQAGRELAEVESGKKGKPGTRNRSKLPQSLCTINPLHGEAQSTTRLDADSSGVRVPVCGSCQNDLQVGNQLQWIFDGDTPYAEGESIWAQTLFGAIGGDLVTALHRQGR